MKNVLKALVVIYVIALTCSMAAMELAGWAAAIFFTVWCVWGIWKKKIPISIKPIGVEISASVFVLIVLVGLLINDQDSDLIYSFGRVRNILLIFIFPFVFNLFEKKERLIKLLWICGTIISIYGIWQHFTGIDLWRHNQRALLPVPWGDRTVYSTVGFFNHHLTYGHSYMMILCLPWAALLLNKKANLFQKFLYCLSFVLIGTSLVFTYGRGVWIAVLVALPLMAFIVSRKLVLGFLTLLLIMGGLFYKFDPFFAERAKSVFSENYKSNQERRFLWQANMQMFRDHPWIGVGYQQNEKLLPKYYSKIPGAYDAMIGHAHNNYIQILATTGILGFVSYLSMMILFLIMSVQLFRAIPSSAIVDRGIALTSLGAQVAFHVGGFTQFNFGDMKVLHMFIFWIVMVANLRQKYKLKPIEWSIIKSFWQKLLLRFSDEAFQAACLAAFTMVFIKKWEPGGNIDTIWYSAIAKNIYLTGDFFHFTISKYYYKDIFDHMPMTYWITAMVFKIMGPSDFAARLYPMICSFISYLLVFRIGTMIKDKTYGLVAVVMYVLCFGATKWNGALMHDVPLTTYFLAAIYYFLKGQKNSKYFFLTALFFVCGVFTKGPIIFGVPLAMGLWTVAGKNYRYLKGTDFYYALLLIMTLLCVPLLSVFEFDGLNIYTMFLIWKSSYLTPTYWFKYLAYFVLVIQMAPFTVTAYAMTPILLARRKYQILSVEGLSILKLCAWLTFSIIVPLSSFTIKYPHYLLPFYPFLALVGAFPVYILVQKFKIPVPKVIHRLSILFLCLFVALPIKTSGTRSKDLINLVNIIKLDKQIKSKDVFFLGRYVNDMAIFQTFKFYGSIDLIPVWPYQIDKVDLDQAYLVTSRKLLPLKVRGKNYDITNCLVYNEYYCVLTNPLKVNLEMPLLNYPHEIY